MLDRNHWKHRAQAALNQAPTDSKRLLLIHVGVMTLASLVLTVIHYYLQLQIDTTGGLSGIAARSMLSTVQSVLQLFYFVLTPFWQAGYLLVAILVARGEPTDTNTLFSGLRRFGPLLRLYLLQILIFGAVFLGSSYLSSTLYMLTPWGSQLMEQMLPMMENPEALLSSEADMALMAEHSLPMLLLGAAIFLVAAFPVFYLLRMSQYRILDGQTSALKAIRESMAMMKGNIFPLFRLDLSFWWFYALEILIGLIGYADILLDLIGHPLPFGAALGFFLPYILYLVLQFGFQLWQKNRIAVTYAVAYEFLRQPKEPKAESKKLPWDNVAQ